MDARGKGHVGMQMKPGGTVGGGSRRQPANGPVVKHTVPSRPRILVVEDQEDVRRMLATALELEGYRVAEAANALEGLDHLGRSHFDLVLTDYAMPGGTGTWMLEEADRLGRMNGAAALIVTAHPGVRELRDVGVIQKPLDLDFFLDRVRSLLPTDPSSATTRPRSR